MLAVFKLMSREKVLSLKPLLHYFPSWYCFQYLNSSCHILRETVRVEVASSFVEVDDDDAV